MSTRAFITVQGLNCGMYRHSDGYPICERGLDHGVLASLLPFCKEFTENRGNDAQYFLARLVENQIIATRQQRDGGDSKRSKFSAECFTGFGIIDTNDSKNVDCAYHYHVDLTAGTVQINGGDTFNFEGHLQALSIKR